MIDELVKSVRLHLSERLTSPLMGALVLSWCAWNYRFLIVVLSGESVEKKFALINGLYSTLFGAAGIGIAFPIVTALGYIYLYPIPAKAVYIHSRKRHREMLDARRKSENETPLTKEDETRIRGEMQGLKEDHAYEMTKRDSEIERLSAALKKAFQLHKELENHIAELEPKSARSASDALKEGTELPDAQRRIIEWIGKSGGQVQDRYRFNGRGLSPVELDYHFDELRSKGFLSDRSDEGAPEFMDLTQRGRAIFLALQNG